MGESDLLHFITGGCASRIRLVGKKWQKCNVAVDTNRVLPHDLLDADINYIFRSVPVSFSRDAVDHNVCILGGRHVVENRVGEAA